MRRRIVLALACGLPQVGMRRRLVTLFGCAALALSTRALAQTWIADNGNGTFTNPPFFDWRIR